MGAETVPLPLVEVQLLDKAVALLVEVVEGRITPATAESDFRDLIDAACVILTEKKLRAQLDAHNAGNVI